MHKRNTEEKWIDVYGFEDHYSISDYGRLYRKPYVKVGRNEHGRISYQVEGKVVSPYEDGCGYYWHEFYKKLGSGKKQKRHCLKIHRIVAENFIRSPEEWEQVNHINGDKKDNRVSNLEWVSCQQNIQHSFEYGLKSHVGSSHPSTKFSEEDVVDIIHLRKEGLTLKEISEKYKVHKSTIGKITTGKNWSHLDVDR